ncbi:integrase [Comamonas thiooxydans]|nr:integrase [Comamonas thiooxydans]
MKQRPRIYYTEAQKALMWDRWKAGDTLREIGKLFDRPHTSIHTILSATGGIRPPVRRRSRWALSMSEREEISRALAAGESIRCVAGRLKRAASTISRELLRNGGKTGYRAAKADEAAWTRARRPKTCKLASNPALAHIVAVK